MENILSIVSVALGVAGLGYGFYQDRTKEKLRILTRKNAWSTYRSCYQTFLNIWRLHEQSEKPLPLELAKAEEAVRELHRKCIENVIDQYDALTEKDLENWHKHGKLVDDFSLTEFKREIEVKT